MYIYIWICDQIKNNFKNVMTKFKNKNGFKMLDQTNKKYYFGANFTGFFL